MKLYKPLVSSIALLMVSVLHAKAQVDSTGLEQKKQMPKLSGYIGGVFERSPVAPGNTNTFGLQGAVLWNKHWQIGVYGIRYSNDNYRQQLIFPNFFQMNYKHGGLLLGYRTHLQKKYEFMIESKVGWGETKWKELDSGETLLADKFQLIHLQLGGDYVLTRFLAINAYLGYRWMNGLDITGLENEDFNGVYYGFVTKIGLFR